MNVLVFQKQVSGQIISEQGMPYIQNFEKENLSYLTDQTWYITIDNDGVIYAANNNGVIEYDGSFFKLYKIDDDVEIRSIAYDEKLDRIYVGAYSEFGYFQKTANGDKKYVCLSDSMPDIQVNSTWKIFCTTHGTYFFISKNQVVKYFENKLTKIKSFDNSEFRGFLVNDTILAADVANGLLVENNNKLEKLNFAYNECVDGIRAILPETDTSYIFVTTSSGLVRWCTGGINSKKNYFVPIENTINSYLIDNSPYYGIKNKDSYLIATLTGGVVILDKNLNTRTILKKENGLSTNGIYFLCNDKNSNIWIGCEKGISVVDINSPYLKFSDLTGLKGTLSSIKRFNDIIYVGTYDGLFYLKNNTVNSITSKEIFITNLFSFKPLGSDNDVLIGSSLRNIIQVYGTEKIEKIEPIYSCFSIVEAFNKDNKLFFGHYDGLTSFNYNLDKDGNIKLYNRFDFKEIGFEVSNLTFDNDGNLWGSTTHDGIFVVDLGSSKNESDYIVYDFGIEQGLPSKIGNKIYNYKGKILIATRNGLYEMVDNNVDISKYSFKNYNSFFGNYIKDSVSIYSLDIDSKDNIWFITSSGILKYLEKENKFISEPFKNIKDIRKDNIIYSDSNNLTWIGVKDILYNYNGNITCNYNSDDNVLIRKVLAKNYELYSGAYIENEFFSRDDSIIKYLKKIDYKDNTLTFEFSLPFYVNSNLNSYSTYLQGLDEEWTEWSFKTERSFTNLKAGKYIFYVKAKNGYDIESSIVGFEFVIKPPWYMSIIAYILYVVILVVVIVMIMQYRTNKIINTKKELENIIKLRTSQIEQQKEEIETQSYKLEIQTEKLASQTEKLTLSNNELKHLSMVAQETDNSVVLLDKRGRFEWWNKGFTQLFGYRFEKYKDADFKTKQKMLRPDLQKEIKNYTKEKGTISYTAHDVFENGQEIWYQTTINPVNDETGEVFRFVAIDFDITKLKLAEFEINKQKEEIQIQAEKLRYINIELSKQRNKIAKQNKETTDSILYAKRIQEAMLPLDIFVNVVLPENFILFKPRDIVSGDFYWISHKNGKTIVAAADCTGHGIPGAFMSLLGISALKEIITRLEHITSDEILNRLREQIMIILHQRGKQGEATDGMDIALCIIDDKQKTLQYSGANNPLYIIGKNDNLEYELTRYKPDKMPIGIHYNASRAFSQQTVKLKSKDTIYIFTDGYVDQFGEHEDKKFLSKNFKNLLIEIQDKSMVEQKEMLEETIEKWKGRRYQVDDILVIGIRMD